MTVQQKFEALRKLLFSRLGRNLFFWAADLYMAFSLNAGNEPIHHYRIICSSWYLPVMGLCLILQCSLVYTNNLFLIPTLLVKRRRLLYLVYALLLSSLVAVLYVILFKAAQPHLNVTMLQHPGFTTTGISPNWSLRDILFESETFLFSNVLWLFAFSMAWFMSNYAVQKRALDQSEKLRIQAELAFLKNQINPHFLFNTLNNIYGLTLRKDDLAPEAVLKLASMLRYLLYESDIPEIPFQQERIAIESYVEIEALRLPDDANIHLDIFADKDYKIPPLLWMAQLENCFKHGTRLIGIPLSVFFSYRIEMGILHIKTKNTCRLDSAETPTEGIGLANLRKRLQILYPNRYTLLYSKEANEFISELTIQLA